MIIFQKKTYDINPALNVTEYTTHMKHFKQKFEDNSKVRNTIWTYMFLICLNFKTSYCPFPYKNACSKKKESKNWYALLCFTRFSYVVFLLLVLCTDLLQGHAWFMATSLSNYWANVLKLFKLGHVTRAATQCLTDFLQYLDCLTWLLQGWWPSRTHKLS